MPASLPMTQQTQLGVECASRELDVAVDAAGGFWVTWVSHLGGADRVMARRWTEDGPGAPLPVSPAPGEYMGAAVAITKAGPCFIWRSYERGRWSLAGRLIEGDTWREQALPRVDGGDVASFAVAPDGAGGLQLAFVTGGGERSLRHAAWGRRGWTAPVAVHAGAGRPGRPALAVAPDGTAWLAWDVYDGGSYAVYAAAGRSGQWQAPLRVSEGEEWQLLPSVACTAEGRPYLAWLTSQRVVDEHGVYDHHPWAACATFEGGAWRLIGDEAQAAGPPGAVESLAQGLLTHRNYMGYYGRRRHPMLLAGQGEVRLLWERKKAEDFGTANWGALCARRFDGERWHPARELHSGALCYQVDAAAPLRGDRVRVAYKGDPRQHSPEGHGDILAATVDLAAAPDHEAWPPETWRRWRPLPPRETHREERRPYVDVGGERLYLYWGDLHCHSFQSPDAEGELDELLAYARDVARLDFCAIADNDWYANNILTAGMWREIETATAAFSEPGRFLAFPGYEWTYHGPPTDRWNHRIVFYPGRDRQIHRRVEPAGQDVDAFVRSVCATDALAHAHHKSWSIICEAFDRNVEVCSGWQVHSEDLAEVMVHLAAGHRFGFAGSSDGHRYVPGHGGGLVAVWAPELTTEAVFAALRRRRNYATTGSRIAIDFSVSGFFMGAEGVFRQQPGIGHAWPAQERSGSLVKPVIDVRVRAAAPIVAIDLFRNGSPLHCVAADAREISLRFEDTAAPPGTSFYHARVRLAGETARLPHNSAPAQGNMAWSSPVWVKVE